MAAHYYSDSRSITFIIIRHPGILGQTHECYVAFELEAKYVNCAFAFKQSGTKSMKLLAREIEEFTKLAPGCNCLPNTRSDSILAAMRNLSFQNQAFPKPLPDFTKQANARTRSRLAALYCSYRIIYQVRKGVGCHRTAESHFWNGVFEFSARVRVPGRTMGKTR